MRFVRNRTDKAFAKLTALSFCLRQNTRRSRGLIHKSSIVNGDNSLDRTEKLDELQISNTVCGFLNDSMGTNISPKSDVKLHLRRTKRLSV